MLEREKLFSLTWMHFHLGEIRIAVFCVIYDLTVTTSTVRYTIHHFMNPFLISQGALQHIQGLTQNLVLFVACDVGPRFIGKKHRKWRYC